MHHYVYLIENLVNHKVYIGKHSTENLEDGYMGSGKLLGKAIVKYGLENFRKRILRTCSSEEEAFTYERELVNEDFVARNDTYNLQIGGEGGSWSSANQDTPECRATKQRAARASHKVTWAVGSRFREGHRRRLSERNRQKHASGEIKAPDWTGRRHNEESKRKIGEANSRHQSGEGNSHFGKMWIHHPELKQSKLITKDELEQHLINGWLKGRRLKW